MRRTLAGVVIAIGLVGVWPQTDITAQQSLGPGAGASQAQAQTEGHCKWFCERLTDGGGNPIGWACVIDLNNESGATLGEQCGATINWCILFQGNICLGDPPPIGMVSDDGVMLLGMATHCGLGTPQERLSQIDDQGNVVLDVLVLQGERGVS